MRVFVTGGGGFVGSNLVTVAVRRGDHVVATVRGEPPPQPEPSCRYVQVDLLDDRAVRRAVTGSRPDVIVHTAIWNDFTGIYADRAKAWASYVGVTRLLSDAANRAGAVLVTVSTDWVFDGTQSGATETTPPNPINYYGVLKAASELVTLERTHEPVVARIAGVMGVHRAGLELPRRQDAGFGYFVAAVVEALRSGREFAVWESEAINMVATPSLASLSSEWMLELAEQGRRGIFHCCGGEATARLELARATAEAFGLDPSLITTAAPDPAQMPPAPIPRDTSLDATETARTLGRRAPSVRDLLELFARDVESSPSARRIRDDRRRTANRQ
jgi:dTDP-4-dehydrorhamnose reductase